MKVSELVKISKGTLELMSKHGLRLDDWRHIAMYEEYCLLRAGKEKFRYIIALLAERYEISESTVKRVVKRLSREVIM